MNTGRPLLRWSALLPIRCIMSLIEDVERLNCLCIYRT